MGLNAEYASGSFILKSRNDIKKLEELVSDFLYYGEGETSDSWNRIPFKYEKYEETGDEIFFSWEFPSGNGVLTGVSLLEVENKMGITIDINNVENSLEEQEVDWEDFSEVCMEIWYDNQIEFSEENMLEFRKELNETEDILDAPLFEHSTQTIEDSHTYEEEEKHFNSLDENGQKTLNLVSLYSKEHCWESNASEFIGFESIEDEETGLKNYVKSIANSLQKTDLIHLTYFYSLSDKDEETFSASFNFDLIYDVKRKVFQSQQSPSEEDLHPIYEYFSNLNGT